MLQAMSSTPPPSAPTTASITSSSSSSSARRRKPLQILTGIFTRKNNSNTREMLSNHSSDERDNFFLSSDENDVDMMWDSLELEGGGGVEDGGVMIPEPREALHSPYHARTIDQDMQNLRLSRQDNPFLQVLASRECLNESDDGGSEYEEKNLMSKENMSTGGPGDPLSLEEVHARLVRSPPPVMWTRSRNSEPSFTHLTTSSTHHHNNSSSLSGGDFIFQFPPSENSTPSVLAMGPSPTLSCRSQGGGGASHHHHHHHHHHSKFLGPFRKDSTLDILTAKFNLSPQPRRRPPSIKGGGGCGVSGSLS